MNKFKNRFSEQEFGNRCGCTQYESNNYVFGHDFRKFVSKCDGVGIVDIMIRGICNIERKIEIAISSEVIGNNSYNESLEKAKDVMCEMAIIIISNTNEGNDMSERDLSNIRKLFNILWDMKINLKHSPTELSDYIFAIKHGQ